MTTLLVIDDDRLHCDLLQLALSRHGYRVSTATSGREGVALFRQLRPAVTLLDLRMPEMDGLAVLKEIRTHDPRAGVIMLGGGATEELENLARKLRVTDFFRKGLSLDVLVGAVHRIAQQARREASDTQNLTASETDQPSEEQILVVDDDVMARDLLMRFLSLRGYHVRGAKDGREALRMIEASAPDLVILDLVMPEMNGVELLKVLAERDYAGRTIILSGHQNEPLLEDAWALGPQEVLDKPLDLERALMAIQLVMVCREC
ncbi:MAG TPA: response regulator [Nitrospira sp.]|nr:response regulator [Nitrospira sp.]MCE7978426.1 response regulator [Nitrospira sp. NTP1]HQR14622.1 response regulator [Nitrospira sp.]